MAGVGRTGTPLDGGEGLKSKAGPPTKPPASHGGFSHCCEVPTQHRGLSPAQVTQWGRQSSQPAREETPMARKDKGGRSSKKAASKSLKEKRQAKKVKKAAKANQHKPL